MLSGILISGREWKNNNKREDFALKLKSENLPICEKELQQRWPSKPPENTPVLDKSTNPVLLFLFLQRKDDWKLFNYRKWDKDDLIDFWKQHYGI